LSRGTLKLVKIAGWPLRRKIRIVQLREAFTLKAVQHFLQLAQNRIPEIRVVNREAGRFSEIPTNPDLIWVRGIIPKRK
jgi:hypothetical protein